mgnify:CR=1 FL=1|jgi:hypothetical protein
MIVEKFLCIECKSPKPVKNKVYGTNWCIRCYDNELMRSYKEDSCNIVCDYPTIFKRPQKFNLSPEDYKKYGY